MLVKPSRPGVIFGEVHTARVGTRSKTIVLRGTDEEGEDTTRILHVDQKVEDTLVWNGRDWVTQSQFAAYCRGLRTTPPKPKTIRRPGK